jgi:hypothetical protein
MKITGETPKKLGENPIPVLFRPPQTSHDHNGLMLKQTDTAYTVLAQSFRSPYTVFLCER